MESAANLTPSGASQSEGATPPREGDARLISGGVISPPVIAATHITVTLSAAEIALTLGRGRQMFNPQTNVPAGAVIEWFQTCSLNPVTALQLRDALARAIQIYETQFGSIPRDPTFRLAEGAPAPAPSSR
jgi:hypothetical protein